MTTEERKHSQWERELELRGITLEAAINFEVLLVTIIYFSNADQYIPGNESQTLKVKNLTFGKKLKEVQKCLSKHHLDLLKEYADLFSDLDDFKELRNKLVHCAIVWFDEDLNRFQIWDATEDPSKKIQFYAPIEYQRDEIAKSIVGFISKITQPLLSLEKNVRHRLSQTHPEIHAVLLSGVPPAPLDR
jgi:hypothetical protein